MRKMLGVAALMLAFCCPTLAGEIPNPPAPQPQKMTIQETTGVTDTLTQIVLTLLVSILP
jgi:hypothetical protein